MTSIDELFKKPVQSNLKRKEPPITPDEIYKAAKHSQNGDVKGKEHKKAGLEEQDDDGTAGPELPSDEEEEGGPDEEEGRFFGGGVTRNTKDVLDFMEEQDGDQGAPEKIDSVWLRRTALNFEKRINKNAELRAKHEDDPQKFMTSEAELDADIKALSILTDHPELYSEFARLGCARSLVSLLSHENTDIAINAIEILSELTDEDVQAAQSRWDSLVDAMLESDLPDLLVQNFARLDESNESDRSGVYYSLSLIENLASQTAFLDKALNDSSLLKWLLSRIRKKESQTTQNKQYAAEVLAIILQTSDKTRKPCMELDAVDLFLQLLSAYRKRDPPKDSDEEEFAENIFDCLTCLVETRLGKLKYLEAEGVELCLIMIKEGKFSGSRALRVLDHSMGGKDSTEVCRKVVESAGLKPLFKCYMKSTDEATSEHIIGMFASMLRLLPGNSAPRVRMLAKFVEHGYAVLDRLVKRRRDYAERLAPIDKQIKREKAQRNLENAEVLSDEWLSRRLDAGLFCLQTLDVVLAWLAAEDAGARTKIAHLFAERDETLRDIQNTLKEQLESLKAENDEASRNDMDALKTLIELLD